MKAALLPDRGVVKVAGAEARTFLNGLLTTDVTKVTPEQARFGALLTPQGKIIVDCIVAEAPAADGGGFFLDCPRALAPGLVEKLNFYKLRAKVTCEDLVKRARAARPKLAVLLTSGFSEAAMQSTLMANNQNALLSKPYRKQDLARKVREILRGA